jgi:hypothetical protein
LPFEKIKRGAELEAVLSCRYLASAETGQSDEEIEPTMTDWPCLNGSVLEAGMLIIILAGWI